MDNRAMNNRITYRPLTVTPFKRNSYYAEFTPSKELQSAYTNRK